MKAKTKLLLLLALCFCQSGFGQKQWSNWYFNGQNRLTFSNNNNQPQLQSNFINPPPTNWANYRHSYQAGTSWSDPTTGEMRFLVAGNMIYDKNYDMIDGSWGLRACPGDKYSLQIILFAGDPDKFYIIQFQDPGADIRA